MKFEAIGPVVSEKNIDGNPIQETLSERPKVNHELWFLSSHFLICFKKFSKCNYFGFKFC